MNYKQPDVTKRIEESPLFKDLERQDGDTIPYLLERYLLLENWRYLDRIEEDRDGRDGSERYDFAYLHLLLAEACTVLLSQEERIRKLEALIEQPKPPTV